MSDCRFGVSPVNYPDPEGLFSLLRSTGTNNLIGPCYRVVLGLQANLNGNGLILFLIL